MASGWRLLRMLQVRWGFKDVLTKDWEKTEGLPLPIWAQGDPMSLFTRDCFQFFLTEGEKTASVLAVMFWKGLLNYAKIPPSLLQFRKIVFAWMIVLYTVLYGSLTLHQYIRKFPSTAQISAGRRLNWRFWELLFSTHLHIPPLS